MTVSKDYWKEGVYVDVPTKPDVFPYVKRLSVFYGTYNYFRDFCWYIMV